MEEYIKLNYKTMTKNEMANKLGVSYNKVDWLMRKLHLTKYSSITYSNEELKFIKDNYSIYGSRYCALKLNRSENAINKKIKNMGLTINYKYIYVNKNGYFMNCEDRNHRYLVHRKVMEEYLGRKLKNNEIVHHKDMNKLNNDISNLEIMSRSEHTKLHNKYLKSCQYKI